MRGSWQPSVPEAEVRRRVRGGAVRSVRTWMHSRRSNSGCRIAPHPSGLAVQAVYPEASFMLNRAKAELSMRMVRHGFNLILLGVSALYGAERAAAAPLLPHRAVYDLKLVSVSDTSD